VTHLEWRKYIINFFVCLDKTSKLANLDATTIQQSTFWMEDFLLFWYQLCEQPSRISQ